MSLWLRTNETHTVTQKELFQLFFGLSKEVGIMHIVGIEQTPSNLENLLLRFQRFYFNITDSSYLCQITLKQVVT